MRSTNWLVVAVFGSWISAAGVTAADPVPPAVSEAAAEKPSPSAEKPVVTFGGFVDTYYAYDFNQPGAKDRGFTTQPARHNEFNINLAYLDAKLAHDRFRGRLALQVGTSVQSNYAGEPTMGVISGPSLARHIQEAVVGVRLFKGFWLDAGIYFSHIGLESFISKDNWTYSRSLMSDYSPYYQTGVKASYQIIDQLAVQLHVMNGWQNISDNNENKGLGAQVAFMPNSRWSLTYNNFFGTETGTQWRFFNDLIAKVAITDSFEVAAVYDIGLQSQSTGANSVWHVGALLMRYRFHPVFALALRGERYMDPDQVIVPTGTAGGFQVWGASVNADVSPWEPVLWRTEFRVLASDDAIYPGRNGTLNRLDPVVISSLAVHF